MKTTYSSVRSLPDTPTGNALRDFSESEEEVGILIENGRVLVAVKGKYGTIDVHSDVPEYQVPGTGRHRYQCGHTALRCEPCP